MTGDQKFGLGDVVKLASGSVPLTITQALRSPDGGGEWSYRATYYHEGKFLDVVLTESAFVKQDEGK